MKIDPKQIAKMITEDPDEVNPLDDIRDEYESNDDEYDGECDWCGVGIHAGGDHMDNWDRDFNRIYAEVDRLSKTEEALEYLKEHAWWLCSTSCAREQRDALKEEMAQHAAGNNDHENRPISHLDITREAGYYWKLRQPTETVDGSHARQLAIARAEHAWRMTHITRGELEDAYRRLKFDTFRQQVDTNNITEDPNEVNPLDDIEDEYEEELGFCDGIFQDRQYCSPDIDIGEGAIGYDSLTDCEKCGYWWCEICIEKRSGFDFGRLGDPDAYGIMASCPNCSNTLDFKTTRI